MAYIATQNHAIFEIYFGKFKEFVKQLEILLNYPKSDFDQIKQKLRERRNSIKEASVSDDSSSSKVGLDRKNNEVPCCPVLESDTTVVETQEELEQWLQNEADRIRKIDFKSPIRQ